MHPVRYLLQDGVNTVRYLLSNGVKVFVVCFVEERKVMFNFLKGGLLCVEN